MMEVAQTFEDSEKYVKAAQEFRLPYWDYYRPRSYETVFPGVTMGKDRNTGELLNLEDTTFTNKDTGKSITMKDVKIETKQNFEDGKAHSVEPFVSTEYPYDFGMPQIFMLERVMMRLPPHDKLKLEHNPLRTFWFPNNDEIPGEQWNLMGMKASLICALMTSG